MTRFAGSLVALPTPFRGAGAESIDFPAMLRLIEHQLDGGSDGLVVGGTTGEAPTLSLAERQTLFGWVAGVVRRRVPVLAGVGASDTRVACELARSAEHAGADGLLACTPSYNRPSQEGLRRHFAALADASRLPIVLYNIPGRTGVDLLPQTISALAREHPQIVGLKEASGSFTRLGELVDEGAVDVLWGNDEGLADALQRGAKGVIGVVGNLVPATVKALVHAFDGTSEPEVAPALVEQISPLVAALGLETNPAPLKTGLELLGWCDGGLRLPLVTVSAASRARIERALSDTGLLG